MSIRVAIDTGGTFTDLVLVDNHSGTMRSLKVPSTPRDPLRAFVAALVGTDSVPEEIQSIVHGTTVATNALIERTGANVAFITTAGHEDMLYIQRINRQDPYDLTWTKPIPLVKSRKSCFGLAERLDANGHVVTELDDEDVRQVAEMIRDGHFEAVAVCLLFSYLNDVHERRVADILREELPNIPLSLSHQVAPVWREYERASTTVADAYLKPIIKGYTSRLKDGLAREQIHAPLSVMKSNGGIMGIHAAGDAPVEFVMSGPAGGMVAVKFLSDLLDLRDIFSIDIGGTSADIGIVSHGSLTHTTDYEIEWGIPASTPVIDIRTIGAGGGSIAWVDNGGLLHVGPQSAGAVPGPVCYGQGGQEPTLTDANLLLGRLNPQFFLAGKMDLDVELADVKMQALGNRLGLSRTEVAASIIEIAIENMVNSIRMVSVDRGYDPRRFALMAFGGAGGLHAAFIADKLGIPKVVIPPYPGATSAFGMLVADLRIDKIWTKAFRSDQVNTDTISQEFERLRDVVGSQLQTQGHEGPLAIHYFVNMRYKGQNYEREVEVQIPLHQGALSRLCDNFHQIHHTLYGYSIPESVIELIAFRVTALGSTVKPQLITAPMISDQQPDRDVYFPSQGWVQTHVIRRNALGPDNPISGPIVVEEEGSTTVVPFHWTVTRTRHDVLILEVANHE